MNSPLSVAALVIALAAAGLGGYAAMQDHGASTDHSERLAAVEEQLDRVEHALEVQASQRREDGPLLSGTGPHVPTSESAPVPR